MIAWLPIRLAPNRPSRLLPRLICLSWLACSLAGSSLVLFPGCCHAAAADAHPATRFLLVVENSRRMKPRADLLLQSVRDILGTGIRDHARSGDTLGIWTFNQELHAGFFPLETWSPEAREIITLHVLTFLNGLKYANLPNFDPVLPELDLLVRNSEAITVVLVSTPGLKIHGTPFDSRINDAYVQWSSQLSKPPKLFVTVLHASQGRIIAFSVTPDSFPLDLTPPSVPPMVALADKATLAAQPPPPSSPPPPAQAEKQPQPKIPDPPKPQPESPPIPTPQNQIPIPILPPTNRTQEIAVAHPQPELPKSEPVQVIAKNSEPPTTVPSSFPPAVATPVPSPAIPLPSTPSNASPAPSLAAPETTTQQPPPFPPTTPTAQLATELPPQSTWSRVSLWTGSALGLGTLGFTLFFLLRPRPARSNSLISRALEHERLENSPQPTKSAARRPKP